MNLVMPQPITVGVIQRPDFDNTRIASFRLWLDDNANALARYWHEQGNVLGMAPADNTDFDFWLRVQHDIEVSYDRR